VRFNTTGLQIVSAIDFRAATVKVGALILNDLVLLFVVRLVANLEPDIRAEQALWLVTLFIAPPANALAILPKRSAS